MAKALVNAKPVPHSWDIEHWPTDVYPHSEARARYLIRAHKDQLILAGALTRVGRELVVLGEGYSRWLQQKRAEVPNFVAGQRIGNGATA